MVFNATFNNVSVISWRPILLVKETGVPGVYHIYEIYVIPFDKKFDMKMLIHQKEIRIKTYYNSWDLLVTKYLKLYEYQFFVVFRFNA